MLAVVVFATLFGAQGSGRAVQMTGVVVNGSGKPVVGAHVVLVRHAESAEQTHGTRILAQADTDSSGSFSFGAIDLQTEIRFPLETGAWLEYTVTVAGTTRLIGAVEFTTPRSGPDAAVASVYARLTVQ